MRLLIATAQRPATEEKAFAFNECIRKSASEASLFIPQGILWTEGPGCANLAFDIEGGEDTISNSINGGVSGGWGVLDASSEVGLE